MIARVFPRRTAQTPRDELAFIGWPQLFVPEVEEVHISVTFTWDLPLARKLAEAWERVAPVKLGGPATGARGGRFTPGKYLAEGNVITSRGCPNRCWFCSVWKRDGELRELPITKGWNVQDDNLLACSDDHVRAVFAMLDEQRSPERRIYFTGGLEAARLEPWHAEALREIHTKQVFFAYDTKDDLEPLRAAGELMLRAGFTRTSHTLRCYVLIGYPRDQIPDAELRLQQTMEAGFLPMAMLWRDKNGGVDPVWAKFQRKWARPAIIGPIYRVAGQNNPNKPLTPANRSLIL